MASIDKKIALTATNPTTISTFMKSLLFTTTGAVFVILGAVNAAQAEILTVPSNLSSTEGNVNNASPFKFAGRNQQIFAASEFTFLSQPALITKISFRPDAFADRPFPFSATIPNIQIALSTTSARVDGLSVTFANNIGADETVVFSGALSLSSAFTGPATGPKDFDISINLQTPFLYDPSLGNLLLDVKNFSDNGEIPVFDAQDVLGDSVSRRWTDNIDNVNSPTALLGLDGTDPGPTGYSNSIGLVTMFTLSTSTSVPEPSTTLGLTIFGFAALLTKKKLISSRKAKTYSQNQQIFTNY
jgi:hypothetical protein